MPWLDSSLSLSFVSYLGSLKQINQRLLSLATTDALTDLLNQRAFSDLAAVEIKRSRRYKRPFTVVFLDLDDFKAINDTFGHRVGNELLQTVAVTLRAVSRASDYLDASEEMSL